MYHTACINRWSKSTCPTCSTEFSANTTKYITIIKTGNNCSVSLNNDIKIIYSLYQPPTSLQTPLQTLQSLTWQVIQSLPNDEFNNLIENIPPPPSLSIEQRLILERLILEQPQPTQPPSTQPQSKAPPIIPPRTLQ